MASSTSHIASSFIEDAPPGELTDVISDIKSLTSNDSSVIASLTPAFKTYNEAQYATVKLPGGTQEVIVSEYNQLEDGRYFDVESQSSFSFDHAIQKASDVQSYVLESANSDLIKSLIKSLAAHVKEHYPSPSTSFGVYPIEGDSAIAILIAASKYSPSNFWNGRWRSLYTLNPTSSSLKGMIRVDVHYYEDGNVRLLTNKPLTVNLSSSGSPTASEIVRAIANSEKKYQEDLNHAFGSLSEGAFKGLRRQLPVTRQKVEWEKVSGYRLGQDIGGGRSR